MAHLPLPVSLLGDFNAETLLPILNRVTRDYRVDLISKDIGGEDLGDGLYATRAIMSSAIESMNASEKVMSFLLVNQGGHHYSLSVIARAIPRGQQKFSLTRNLTLLHFDSQYPGEDTSDSYLDEYRNVTAALLKDFNTAGELSRAKVIVLCKESTQVADYCGMSCVVAARALTLLHETAGEQVRLLNGNDFPETPEEYGQFADNVSLNVSDLTILWPDADFEAEAA